MPHRLGKKRRQLFPGKFLATRGPRQRLRSMGAKCIISGQSSPPEVWTRTGMLEKSSGVGRDYFYRLVPSPLDESRSIIPFPRRAGAQAGRGRVYLTLICEPFDMELCKCPSESRLIVFRNLAFLLTRICWHAAQIPLLIKVAPFAYA